LNFRPGQGLEPDSGDVLEVTTWNDTRQQNILTQVFVGPVGISNNLDLGRIIINADRLWVTLNGRRLYYGFGFNVVGQELILTSGILGPNDLVMITQFTESVVPEPMAFRIFQDMRGVQITYRMTVATTTQLAQPLGQYDDIIYLVDASTQGEPNLAANVWGVLTVNGERIMYRERDVVNNTISSLLRGTAGTASASHDIGSTVYSLGRGNLLPEAYQNYIDSNTFTGDGITTTFVASNISFNQEDSTLVSDALQVFVGGIRQSEHFIGDGFTKIFDLSVAATADLVVIINGQLQVIGIDYSLTGIEPYDSTRFDQGDGTGPGDPDYPLAPYDFSTVGTTLTFTTAPPLGAVIGISAYTVDAIDPVEITFKAPPKRGLEVLILVRRGVTWYAPGPGTPSNGVALQDTNTPAARFLRGLT
jgi:hypothetical protein